MNPVQKVIKYFAIAFAIFLTIGIFTGIFGIIAGISTGVEIKNSKTQVVSFSEEFTNVTSLEVECANYSVTIQTGDRFLVEAKNVSDNYQARLTQNGTLVIGFENQKNWFFNLFSFIDGNMQKAEVIVSVPENFIANKINIDGGSGFLNVDGLHSKELRLDLGSGGMKGTNIVADDAYIDGGSGEMLFENIELSEVVIDAGSGSLTIQEAWLNDLDLDAGTGSININGYLHGDSKIDGGSGNITLAIKDTIDNFNLRGDAGSGGIWLAGEKMMDDFKRNNITANNSIYIDGGSGRVALDFQ